MQLMNILLPLLSVASGAFCGS